jgi:wobble nucleotide-excising tRNase
VIERIQLLRNVGQFDSVNSGSQIPLTKLSLVYAENGRGKTTLAAILRSLSSGEANFINDRRRLGTANTPHIVLIAGTRTFIFQNGAWSANWPNLTVFDDLFVAENICSGIEIQSDHRQNLHELILGARGVGLNSTVQGHVTRIEEHNQSLRNKGNAIPSTARGNYSVDDFCALEARPHIDELIQEGERGLAAAKASAKVRQTLSFTAFELPRFNVVEINTLLQRSLSELETESATHVQSHLIGLGSRGETWVEEGVSMIASASEGKDHEICPFCSQTLTDSTLIQHYRSYFSAAYTVLKLAIIDQESVIITTHGGDAPSSFERDISTALQRREFWKSLTDVPEINVDTAEIARSWKSARDAVLDAIRPKREAPLEKISLQQEALSKIDAFHRHCDIIAQISGSLLAVNPKIDLIKESAANPNVAVLESNLVKLKAIKARYNPAIAPLCQAYINEKSAKLATERARDSARAALDQYRQTVFPRYESTINTYLQRLNAGFRLGSVTSVNSRGGPSCTYNIMINNTPVAATSNDGATFANTLSAGDRNTLALAFFFASLEQDPNIQLKTVIIDDPLTSLDEHRSLATIREIRRLIPQVNQVIVLSHSKPFLCGLWQGIDQTTSSALKITRDGAGSTLMTWDVNRENITEHDYRHALLAEYMDQSNPAIERAVATALRPIIEMFIRVAYPQNFTPGSLLGPFVEKCHRELGSAKEILNQQDLFEIQDLLAYANRFHHDTNPAWQTEIINDQELLNFCRRTLIFTRRG